MRTSENIADLAAALATAQGQYGTAAKDAVNPHFKNRYASLVSIFDACLPALNANGVAVIQGTSLAVPGAVTVITRLQHSSGQWIETEVTLPVSKADAQGVGSAITYGRRYGLQSAVGIVAEEDDDANAATGSPRSPEPARQQPKAAPAPKAAPKDSMTKECKDFSAKLEKTYGDLGFESVGDAKRAANAWFQARGLNIKECSNDKTFEECYIQISAMTEGTV